MNKKSQGFTVDKRRNQRGSPGCQMKKQKIKKNYESIFCSMLQSIDKDVEGGGQAISCWRANCKSRERASFARARARDRERERERVTRVRARVNDAWYFSKKASSSMRCA